MPDQQIEDRYPIGKFSYEKKDYDKGKRNVFISEIETAPSSLRNAAAGLSEIQLDTPYREGGWRVRQVIHHLPDSHLNAYVRFKLALTENNPLVKTYDEKKWAELTDYSNTPIEDSLSFFDSLHKKWVILLKSLDDNDFKKTYLHPELGEVNLDWATAQYAWHGKHHVAHITSLRKRMKW